jgi:hypothetical protein
MPLPTQEIVEDRHFTFREPFCLPEGYRSVKWLFNRCRHHEANLSLLAAGELPEAERARVMAHFTGCDTCRAKFAELQNLAHSLTGAGERLPEVEAPVSLRRRWMSAVRESVAVSDGALGTRRPTGSFVLGWLSGRRVAYGSLAAMWVLVLFFRFSAPGAFKPTSLASAPPVSLREVLLALKVERASPLSSAEASKSSHPKQNTPDALPRSQRSHDGPADLEVA